MTSTPVLNIDRVYNLPPANVSPPPCRCGTELVSKWPGHEAALFHRMSNASLDNLSFGTFNIFANR